MKKIIKEIHPKVKAKLAALEGVELDILPAKIIFSNTKNNDFEKSVGITKEDIDAIGTIVTKHFVKGSQIEMIIDLYNNFKTNPAKAIIALWIGGQIVIGIKNDPTTKLLVLLNKFGDDDSATDQQRDHTSKTVDKFLDLLTHLKSAPVDSNEKDNK